MIWSHEHAEALRSVFEALDNNNIHWMIMRNYEGLPEINTSKDIDIAIPRKDWKRARDVIYTILRKRGYKKVIFTKFQSILCHTFYKIDEDNIIALKIDIFACYEWRGAEYVSFEKLYEASSVYNGMHVPEPAMDAVMLFLKPLLLGGVIKEKYRQIYMRVISENSSKAMYILEDIVGQSEASRLMELVINGNDQALRERYKIVRKKLWVRGFKLQPVVTLQRLIGHYWTELRRRVISNTNNVFAVLGSDGVGKSTFIENLKSLLVEHIPMEEDSIQILIE